MLFAFLDESYTRDRYYIAAFVVDEANLGDLKTAVDDCMTFAGRYGVLPFTELHAHKIMSGSKGWEPLKGRPRHSIEMLSYALERFAQLPVRMIIRGVDVARLNARYRYPDPPHRVALQHLLEQVNAYAARQSERVVIIADEIAGKDEYNSRMSGYQITGTPGYRSSTLPFIDFPIEFADSRQSPGLQVVDAMAYIYRRYDGHTENAARTRNAVQRMWGSLAPIREHVWVWVP